MAGLAQTPCEGLKSLAIPDTEITQARLVPAGPFSPPGTLPPGTPAQPPMMLPASDWNRKFQAVGNGGWAGTIGYGAMALAFADHYATASTDTGHKGSDASFAFGHPEKLVDFAYRAVHEMTVKSKAIITAFLPTGAALSYWNGCSTGGRQGLMEAQRYPEDYDGIIAGAPATWMSHLSGWHMQVGLVNLKKPESLIPPAKYPLLSQAVLAACDSLDGVKDGLLEDPRMCKFDPSTLLCRGDSNQCLTAPQVESAKAVYGPLKTKNGSLFFPGLEYGSELAWRPVTAGPEPFNISLSGFKYVAQGDPTWDWQTFDLDRDTALMNDKADFVDAINPNLQAFKQRGGKLLLYHGWNDQLIPPENTVN